MKHKTFRNSKQKNLVKFLIGRLESATQIVSNSKDMIDLSNKTY